jgi:lipid-A-disaccharide synthase
VDRRTVLILTGEPSGDRAAAAVASEIGKLDGSCRILAVGGPDLESAGAEILQDIAELGAMGFAEVLRQIPRLKRLEDRLRRLIRDEPPSVVVPVDYPGFNLRIAAFARGAGVPVVYFIGPQVWAWGAGRVPRIARCVDRMLVVFPFEEEIYRAAGVRTDFVGHPLLESLPGAPRGEALRGELGIDPGAPLLGLLPGSRAQEVRRIFPVMLEAAALARKRFPALTVVASVSQAVPFTEYSRALARANGGGAVRLREGPATSIMTASDVLLVTSGTATLEAALLGTPLAVLYRTSAATWWIGRRLVKIPRISLVNILAGDELVPEFLQGAARPEPVARHVTELLADPARRRDVGEKLRALRGRLGEAGASRRAAGIILEESRP